MRAIILKCHFPKMLKSKNAFYAANFASAQVHHSSIGPREHKPGNDCSVTCYGSYINKKSNDTSSTCSIEQLQQEIDEEINTSLLKNQGKTWTSKQARAFLAHEIYHALNFVKDFSTSTRYLSVNVDSKKDYYKRLGVTPNCTALQIKQAYYRLSKVYHPDVNKSTSAVTKFHEIMEAYEVLSSPSLKQQYDSDRKGHNDGLHRSTVRRHRMNYNARGPHQYTKSDKYNYDEWFTKHYSETFTRRASDDRYKNKWDSHHENNKVMFDSKRDIKENGSRPSATLYSSIGLLIVTLYYIAKKFKKN